MTREEYLYKLEETQSFLYFHLKPMDEERHNKWINHTFYLLKQEASKIFNDPEAAVKAKDNEISSLKAQHAALYEIIKSLQKQHLYDVFYRTNQ